MDLTNGCAVSGLHLINTDHFFFVLVQNSLNSERGNRFVKSEGAAGAEGQMGQFLYLEDLATEGTTTGETTEGPPCSRTRKFMDSRDTFSFTVRIIAIGWKEYAKSHDQTTVNASRHIAWVSGPKEVGDLLCR